MRRAAGRNVIKLWKEVNNNNNTTLKELRQNRQDCVELSEATIPGSREMGSGSKGDLEGQTKEKVEPLSFGVMAGRLL